MLAALSSRFRERKLGKPRGNPACASCRSRRPEQRGPAPAARGVRLRPQSRGFPCGAHRAGRPLQPFSSEGRGCAPAFGCARYLAWFSSALAAVSLLQPPPGASRAMGNPGGLAARCLASASLARQVGQSVLRVPEGRKEGRAPKLISAVTGFHCCIAFSIWKDNKRKLQGELFLFQCFEQSNLLRL